jgi:hypothetical protein
MLLAVVLASSPMRTASAQVLINDVPAGQLDLRAICRNSISSSWGAGDFHPGDEQKHCDSIDAAKFSLSQNGLQICSGGPDQYSFFQNWLTCVSAASGHKFDKSVIQLCANSGDQFDCIKAVQDGHFDPIGVSACRANRDDSDITDATDEINCVTALENKQFDSSGRVKLAACSLAKSRLRNSCVLLASAYGADIPSDPLQSCMTELQTERDHNSAMSNGSTSLGKEYNQIINSIQALEQQTNPLQ